jgi:hypothetical protein
MEDLKESRSLGPEDHSNTIATKFGMMIMGVFTNSIDFCKLARFRVSHICFMHSAGRPLQCVSREIQQNDVYTNTIDFGKLARFKISYMRWLIFALF